MGNDARKNDPPLYVDLDGTLIATDSLWESVREILRRRPWLALLLPFHLLRGRAAFKHRVAQLVRLDASRLPYRESIVDFLRTEREQGRVLVLATAAHREIAHAVARHLGLFDAVIASDGTRNLKGVGKLSAIRDHARGGPFDYMGDSTADLPIFRACRQAILAHPSKRLLTLARNSCRVARIFD